MTDVAVKSFKFRLVAVYASNIAVERVSFFRRLAPFLDDHIYPTPPLGQDMTQGQFFKRSLTGLNSEFSFS